MALPTNTFATYEAVGNREDLSDVIYRIDPTDTPFVNGVERETARAHPTARITASVLSWIKTNTSQATAGSPADPTTATGTGTRTDGTQLAFTEGRLKTVLQSAWTNGGKPDTIFTGAFNKQQFST